MGTVKGDQVACPFHDWRWGGDGRCAQIPYARRVPPAARTRSWLTLERNGQLFVWHDPEGNPPPDDVTIPRIDGAYSAEWTGWTWDSILVEGANCREVVDNVVDMAHFFYIHFAFPTYFKNVFEGHVATQYLRTRARPDVGAAATTPKEGKPPSVLKPRTSGPSYMIDYLWHEYHGMTVESVLINCHYPVTPTSFMLQWGVIVKRPPGLTDEPGRQVRRQVREVRRGRLRAGRGDLAAQEPGGQPAAVRRGRPGVPAAALVRAVLPRRGRHRAGHDRPLRVRDRHHPRGGGLGGGGRAEPGRRGAAQAAARSTTRPRRAEVRPGPPPCAPTTARPARGRSTALAAARPWRSRSSARSTRRCSGPRRRRRRCAEFRARAAEGTRSALVEGCAALRDSIDAAVAAGRLAVCPPSYE